MGPRGEGIEAAHDERVTALPQDPLLVDHIIDLLRRDQVALVQPLERVATPRRRVHDEDAGKSSPVAR